MHQFLKTTSPQHSIKRLKRTSLGCLLLTFILLLICSGLCFLLPKLVMEVNAQAPQVESRQVVLVIDHSQSMFDRNDPEFLRLEAAQMFITYFGIDSEFISHYLAVVFFGTEATLVTPLTSLAHSVKRTEIITQINQQPAMGWTNPEAALSLAASTLQEKGKNPGTQAIVFLTDGKPQLESFANDPTARDETIAALKKIAMTLSDRNIPLFIILLNQPETISDPEVTTIFLPLWREMAETTNGRFYEARQNEDLVDIYHDIVIHLTQRQSVGVVIDTIVEKTTVETITVAANLSQIVLMIKANNPDMNINIRLPDGRFVSPADHNIRYIEASPHSGEVIWVIENPVPDLWEVEIEGNGAVKLWQDYQKTISSPTPSPHPVVMPSTIPIATSLPFSSPMPHKMESSLLPIVTLPPVTTPAVTSTTIPSSVQVVVSESDQSRSDWPWWRTIGFSIILGILVAGWTFYRRKHQDPLLEGTLRRLTCPTGALDTVPLLLNLDELGKRNFIIGTHPKMDLFLLASSNLPTVHLSTEIDENGRIIMNLRVIMAFPSEISILVNNIPVNHKQTLNDGDIITIDQYKFRYEHIKRYA